MNVYGNVSLIVFDDIQNIRGWEPFVSRLRRKKGIIITDSDSKLLSGSREAVLTMTKISSE